MSTVAERVALARLATGLSQPQMARIIKTSPQWLQKVEAGEIISPGLDKLERLAKATNTSLGYLFGDDLELDIDLGALRRLEQIARYIAPEWLSTLEDVLKAIARLPPGAQKQVWQQIQFTVRLKQLELKELSGGRRLRPLEIHEEREPYEEQP